MNLPLNKIYIGHVMEYLRSLPDSCVNCIVTSPPYYGLRDYGMSGQIGIEENPDTFIESLTGVFVECMRILKQDGTLWINIGDSYCGTSTGTGDQMSSTLQGGKNNQIECGKRPHKKPIGEIKNKDLIGIPWMLAFSLRKAGYYLRQDIIWNKPNPMPESVTDRCTKSHEYIFLLSKSATYYYDNISIMQDVAISSIARFTQDIEGQAGSTRVPGKTNGNMKAVRPSGIVRDRLLNYNSKEKILRPNTKRGGVDKESDLPPGDFKCNKKSVWTITTKPFKEAHFATYPETLIIDCIKAGCPLGGIVLDPFMGAGTTALVARKLDRNFLGCDLNPEYVAIANKRLKDQLGMFI